MDVTNPPETHVTTTRPRIRRVEVNALFGYLDHACDFNEGARVLVVHGMNGVGKTTVLRLLHAVLHRDDEYVASVPFRYFALTTEDGTRVSVLPVPREDDPGAPHRPAEAIDYRLTTSAHTESERVEVKGWLSAERFADRVAAVDPSLARIGDGLWRTETGDTLDVNAVAERCRLWGELKPAEPAPEIAWMAQYLPMRSSRHVRVDRTTPEQARSSAATAGTDAKPSSAVDRLSDELRRLMADARAAHARRAAELDATFPRRAIERIHTLAGDAPETARLMDLMAGINQRRERLASRGLLDTGGGDLAGDFPETLQDPAVRNMLALYVEDAEEKLDAFSLIDDQIQAFLGFLNGERLNAGRKVARVHATTGISVVQQDTGDLVPLQKLSSGEQHVLLLAAELTVYAGMGSLLLVNEPEASQHVAWQSIFLRDLDSAAARIGFDAIVATHSPDILQDFASCSFDPAPDHTEASDAKPD